MGRSISTRETILEVEGGIEKDLACISGGTKYDHTFPTSLQSLRAWMFVFSCPSHSSHFGLSAILILHLMELMNLP